MALSRTRPAGVRQEQRRALDPGLRGELVQAQEIQARLVGGLEEGLGQPLVALQRLHLGPVQGQPVGLDQREAGLPAGVLGDQRAGAQVIDAGGDADLLAPRGALGLVLLPGRARDVGAGADEAGRRPPRWRR